MTPDVTWQPGLTNDNWQRSCGKRSRTPERYCHKGRQGQASPNWPNLRETRTPFLKENNFVPEKYTPTVEHKFTLGLWTVGNIGRVPFGAPVRDSLSAVELVHLLAEVGAYGVNFHDNDLVPITASLAEQTQIV